MNTEQQLIVKAIRELADAVDVIAYHMPNNEDKWGVQQYLENCKAALDKIIFQVEK